MKRIARTASIGVACLALVSCFGYDGDLPLPDLKITTTGLPDTRVGVACTLLLAAEGGLPPYQWSLQGTLPAGLALDPVAGTISGIPTTEGTATLLVRVVDSQVPAFEHEVSLGLEVLAAFPVDVTTSTLANGRVGDPYSVTLAASGGLAPYSWSIVGSLPTGLSLDPASGEISGTPDLAESASFTVTATDVQAAPDADSQALTLTIDPRPALTITTSSLAYGVKTETYSQALAATGGLPPYTWSVVGSLPSGLALDAGTGIISGTPLAVETASFTIQVTDSQVATDSDSQDLQIQILDLAPRFIFSKNEGYPLSVLGRDSNSGLLRYVSQDRTTGSGRGVTVHPTKPFVYTAGPNSGYVDSWTYDPVTGALTHVDMDSFVQNIGAMVIHPDGMKAYILGAGWNAIVPCTIDQVTGALTPGASVAHAAGSSDGMVITADGQFLYALADTGVTVFEIDAFGGLTNLGTSPAGSSCRAIALHPGGQFLYVSDDAAGQIVRYSVNAATGALTYLGAVATYPDTTKNISIHPTGKYLFLARQTQLRVYSLSPVTGDLTLVPQSVISDVFCVVASPDGRTVYVSSLRELRTYSLDYATGLLALESVVATRYAHMLALVSGPPVEFAPTFAFVANRDADTITSYVIDEATGELGSASTVGAGTAPTAGARTPDGRFLLVPNSGDNTVTSYAINPGTGALTPVSTAATGAGPESVAIEPMGKFCYVVNRAAMTISAFGINKSTGALTPIAGGALTGSDPRKAEVEATGNLLFVTNAGSDTVSVYEIGEANGSLTLWNNVATGDSPVGLRSDPNGFFVYVTCSGANTLAVFRIDLAYRTLVPVEAFPVGTGPEDVAVDARGALVYSSAAVGDRLDAVAHDLLSFVNSSLGSTAMNAHPTRVAIDASGRYLYVLANSSDEVRLYSVDGSTGALTFAMAFSTGANPDGLVLSFEAR